MQVLQKYSTSEIQLHINRKDCWLVIHGKVYDVTTFLEDHPGGEEVLLHAAASGDATKSFEEVGHSSTATSLMEGYLIGTVEGSDAVAGGLPPKPTGLPPRATAKPASSGGDGFTSILLPVLILGIAFAAWYYLTYFNKAQE